jgi:hypothetical protein
MNVKVRKNFIYILANSSNDKIMKIESYQHTHCFILIALQFTSMSELSSRRAILKYERSMYVYILQNNRHGVFSLINSQTVLPSLWHLTRHGGRGNQTGTQHTN